MTLTEQERHDIQRANELGRQPVLLMHGLWLLSSSWDTWRTLIEENGFVAVAPGSPDDPETVAEGRENPVVFARKMIGAVTDRYAEAISLLARKPALIGHSLGGLIVQKLAGTEVAAATVANAEHRRRGGQHHPTGHQHGQFPPPAAQSRVTEYLEIPGRGNSLTIDSGWPDVARVALGFIQRNVWLPGQNGGSGRQPVRFAYLHRRNAGDIKCPARSRVAHRLRRGWRYHPHHGKGPVTAYIRKPVLAANLDRPYSRQEIRRTTLLEIAGSAAVSIAVSASARSKVWVMTGSRESVPASNGIIGNRYRAMRSRPRLPIIGRDR